jgi:hypothetical protein
MATGCMQAIWGSVSLLLMLCEATVWLMVVLAVFETEWQVLTTFRAK